MRDFRWCPQEVAEDCWFDEEHVHICITTPGYRKITPRCGRKAINLFFRDQEPDDIRATSAFAKDPIKGQQVVDECFTESQALAISTFVAETPEAVTVVVNCEAGFSRSPAVVLALRKRYGGDLQPRAHIDPNKHVISTLEKVLGGTNEPTTDA